MLNDKDKLAEIVIGLERYERINREDIPVVALILKNRLSALLMKDWFDNTEEDKVWDIEAK